MTFGERLFHETHKAHVLVDTHPFVTLIRTNSDAQKLYILLNKLCINELQKHDLLFNKKLDEELYRKNIKICNTLNFESLNKLLENCQKYKMELGYMFYGGLMMGGNLLKKIFKDDQEFLTFDVYPKRLFVDMKHYIEMNIDIKYQDIFIYNVNKSYKLIKECFDVFYTKCEN